ncbi:MAG: helix-turn-helix domain-containing protein [Oscillospiraceae bacterium]|jgi:transcriptional regulator with XRE-family HTH domain|nr:helix-turn-helix domain-containing protein [Oscillospiraceae bacterium]
MNIEIANQLLQLRKKHGFSQEQLAEKLGISRQAVSKWERAEASPDTDNLVSLAKIYQVSLDELLLLVPVDKEPEGSEQEESAPATEPNAQNGQESVVIDITSVTGFVKAALAWARHSRWFNFPYAIIALILFITLGSLFKEDGWRFSWLFVVSIPVYYSAGLAIERKNGYFFLYPVLITMIYVGTCLYLEFYVIPAIHLWNRLWVLYPTSFIYYYFVYNTRRKRRLKAEAAKTEKAGE